MIVKIRMSYLIGAIFILLTISCKESKEVIITRDYVINPNWDEIHNSFQVIRLNLKNSRDTINLKKVTQSELLEKLVEDTSFSYTANVNYNGEKYSKRKVYFNRDNGFTWWSSDINSNKKKLGELQQNTWYLLAGLSKYRTIYYVNIDTFDSVHCFKIMASNW